jgi:hypothetical protein
MGRTRYQRGSLRQVTHADGTHLWKFRWWATKIDGTRYRASAILGTLDEFKTESAAQREADKRRVVLNAEGGNALSQSMTFAAVGKHYRTKELPGKAETHTADGREVPQELDSGALGQAESRFPAHHRSGRVVARASPHRRNAGQDSQHHVHYLQPCRALGVRRSRRACARPSAAPMQGG